MNHMSQMVLSSGLQWCQIFINWKWEGGENHSLDSDLNYSENTDVSVLHPKINSSVSLNPRRERTQTGSRMDSFKTTLLRGNLGVTVNRDETNATGAEKKKKCVKCGKHRSSAPPRRDHFDLHWLFFLRLHHRVAPRLNGADFVGSGLDFPEGGQVETHQHSGTL